MGTQSNAQRETQLLAEWITTLPPGYKSKTHVRVGRQALVYNGVEVSIERARAFEVWSDWVDARIFTGFEVWLIEAKIVGLASAYGQLMDYGNQYPESTDYKQFAGAPIRSMVLCAYEKPRTRQFFAGFGIDTVIYSPAWARHTLANKIVGSAIDL